MMLHPVRSAFVRWMIGGACAGIALATTSRSWAQSDIPENDWRRSNRKYESPQHWAFELRFGPYYPNVDGEFKNGRAPFTQVFGDGYHFFFGMELDYQVLRIPHVGTLGPGLGWGYTSMSSKAKLTGTNVDSAEDTDLWIMPMYLVGVLRGDAVVRDLGVPLVPYAKLGLAYAIWKASNEVATSSYHGVDGKGHSWGFHAGFGLALQLDFLDEHSRQELDNSVGINHAYGYFEWVWSDPGGLGSGEMHVGTSSWVTGLAFEI